jgi:hypothetical protein
MKKVFIILLTVAFIFTSTAVFAKEKPDGEYIVGDLVFLRPLGFCALVIGSTAFVLALPMAVITKSTRQSAEALVKKPFDYTFKRPLGEMESGL